MCTVKHQRVVVGLARARNAARDGLAQVNSHRGGVGHPCNTQAVVLVAGIGIVVAPFEQQGIAASLGYQNVFHVVILVCRTHHQLPRRTDQAPVVVGVIALQALEVEALTSGGVEAVGIGLAQRRQLARHFGAAAAVQRDGVRRRQVQQAEGEAACTCADGDDVVSGRQIKNGAVAVVVAVVGIGGVEITRADQRAAGAAEAPLRIRCVAQDIEVQTLALRQVEDIGLAVGCRGQVAADRRAHGYGFTGRRWRQIHMALGGDLEAHRTGARLVDARLDRKNIATGLVEREGPAVAHEVVVVKLLPGSVKQSPGRVDVVGALKKIEQYLVAGTGVKLVQARAIGFRCPIDLGAKHDGFGGRRRQQAEGVGAGGGAGAVYRQGVVAGPQQDERVGAAQRIGVGVVEIARHHGTGDARQGPGQIAVGAERVEINPGVLGQVEAVLVGLPGHGQVAVGRAVQGEAGFVVGDAQQREAVAGGRPLVRRAFNDEGVVAGIAQRKNVHVVQVGAPDLPAQGIEQAHVGRVVGRTECRAVEVQPISGGAGKVVHRIGAAWIKRAADRRVVSDGGSCRQIKQPERKRPGHVAICVHAQHIVAGHQVHGGRGAADLGRVGIGQRPV